MGKKGDSGGENETRLELEVDGIFPPLRAVLNASQNEEFDKQHQAYRRRFEEYNERISNDDARKLVGLWFDLDPSWESAEIARNYRIWALARPLTDQGKKPRDELIQDVAERSRTSSLHWDALAWVFARNGGKRPLGEALHRWVNDVIRNRRPRPRNRAVTGTPERGPEPQNEHRNEVIRYAVFLLKECGRSATHNEATDEQESPSACHLVAEVLAERDHPVKRYESVRDIWRERR